MANLQDVRNRQEGLIFHLREPIGTASRGTIVVYKAREMTVLPETGDEVSKSGVLHSMKIVTRNGQDSSEAAFHDLLQRVQRSNRVPPADPIMGVDRSFICDQGNFCVAFPNMDNTGSVRHIMLSKFPNGMPETFMRLILREVIQGLAAIHDVDDLVHGEISAGHILVSCYPEDIRLAFAATVYEHGVFEASTSTSAAATSSQPPMETIFEWAAAPEIYNSATANAAYTRKADIWMIGVTALEMAYGGFKTTGRNALEPFLQHIRQEKRLPMKEGQQEEGEGSSAATATKQAGKMTKWFKKLFNTIKGKGKGKGKEQQEERVAFSREFEKMVIKCLKENPSKRPSAKKLLKEKVFERPTTYQDWFQFRDALSDED